MAREDQIVAASVETIGLDRVMDEQEPALRLCLAELVHAAHAHPDELEIVLRQDDAAVFHPGAAGRRESLFVFPEIGAAPVIPIARASVDGSLDVPDEIERG